MKLFRNNLAAVMSAGLVFAGVALLFSATGPQVLSVKQTLQVTGGTINGVKLLYTDCPEASIVCSENECDENDECPENTIETYQSYETYPYGTGAGSDFATTVPATYQCNHYKACSNPCSRLQWHHSLSTVEGLWVRSRRVKGWREPKGVSRSGQKPRPLW